MQTSTLRPGLLVSLKTSVRGNISYDRRDIDIVRVTEDGMQIAKWETERTICDPQEYKTACETRSKARSVIRTACIDSAFGLLCPEKSENDLDAAIAEGRRLADEFNANAKLTRVKMYVIVGRIVPDDVEAVRAINSEVRDLLTRMADGIKNLNPPAVRDAGNRARNIGRMLSPEAQARVQAVIDVARSTAKEIVKAGEQAAQEIDLRAIARITEARTAFLEFDEPAAEITTPAMTGRVLDLPPAGPTTDPMENRRGL
jgi:vacuolar-type H+-ATPase subunit H